MTTLSPRDISAGNPSLASVDTTRLTDDTLIIDGYTYFYAAKVVITQAHSLSAVDLTSSNPELSSPQLVQNYSVDADDIEAGQVVLGSTDLVVNYNILASSFVSGQPIPSPVTVTEAENLSPDNLQTEPPQVSSAGLSQKHDLTPDSILSPFPDLDGPEDPNRVIQQEIKEIEQMFGGWPRRAYEVPDGKLVQAEREIEATYGDRVSIDRKAKSVIKFGKSSELTRDQLETVWTVGGNETYVTDNVIEYISSSSASDTQTIRLECHTVEGTGTDAKFTFLVQEVTLNGQTPVQLDTPVARVSHATNSNGTELVGRVTVYENTTVNGGVPADETKIHIDIEQGMQGSLKAATTFSDGDYYVLTGGFGSVSKKQDASADFYLEVRQAGGVFIQSAAVSASKGGPWDITLDPAVIIPKNADIRVRVDSDTNDAVVFTVFKGYLAKVIS